MDISERLGSAVRHLRKRRSVTQTDVADALGVSQGYLSLLENGSRHSSFLSFLEELAHELGLKLSDLFKEAEQLAH